MATPTLTYTLVNGVRFVKSDQPNSVLMPTQRNTPPAGTLVSQQDTFNRPLISVAGSLLKLETDAALFGEI